MKRYVIAALAAGAVMTAVLGSAATLGINDAGVAQYGEATDLSCDATGVTIDGYFVDSEPPSVSNGVVVSEIDGDCTGKTLVASVTDDAGNVLGRGATEINGTSATPTFPSVEIEDIEGVQLTIG